MEMVTPISWSCKAQYLNIQSYSGACGGANYRVYNNNVGEIKKKVERFECGGFVREHSGKKHCKSVKIEIKMVKKVSKHPGFLK